MKVQANQIRPGWVIESEGRQWAVLKIKLLQPGKGSAFIQVEMRDIASGNKSNERWRTADTVEKLMSEEKDAQFLFADDHLLTFMDVETYEQFTLDKDDVGDPAVFLQDGMQVIANFIEGKPIGVDLPKKVVLTVIETEPVVKGQTAASSDKPAIMDNGVRVMVPPFINVGDKLVVATEDGSYVERSK